MSMVATCSVAGCDCIAKARGWCGAHWKRWRRHGNPLGGRTPEGEPMRWIETVALGHTGNGCLKWPYADAGNGYGRVWDGERSAYAHRYICERVHGPAPHRCDASHSCGKGDEGCVSPHHLSWKPHIDNMGDKVRHGTDNRGDRHSRAKLTWEAVRTIRASAETSAALARRYGVSPAAISDVRCQRRWRSEAA